MDPFSYTDRKTFTVKYILKIFNYYDEGTHVLSLDDDIIDIKMKNPNEKSQRKETPIKIINQNQPTRASPQINDYKYFEKKKKDIINAM